MHKIWIIVSTLFFLSFKSEKKFNGVYCKIGKDYRYDLNLMDDSTFILTERSSDVVSECHGRWHSLSQDTLLLKCSEEKDPLEIISRGYMNNRERKVVLLKHGKLKLGDILLKRRCE